MNIFLVHLLWTVLFPLLVSGTVYLILRAFIPKHALPIAIVVAYLASYVVLRPGWPNFPPREYRDYIFILALAGLLWGLVEPLWNKNLLLRWALRATLVLGFLFMLLRNRMRSWSTTEDILWLGGLTLVFLISWWILEKLMDSPKPVLPAPALLLSLIIWIAVFSAMSATNGSSSMAQLAGALAASVGIIMLASFFYKVEVSPLFSSTFIFILGTLLICATIFPRPGIPVWAAILIALSPLFLIVVKAAPTLRGYSLRMAVFALPLLLMATVFVIGFLTSYNQPSF